MAKALRVFVIVGLVLSVGALALGVILFGQREQLKGRTQKMEDAVLAVAQTLTAPRDPHVQAIPERLDREELKTWANPVNPSATMDRPLAQLRNIVANRYEELVNTYADLQAERDAHAATRAELARTRQELADARQEIARLRENLARTEAELAQARQRINELDRQVADLETRLAALRQDYEAAQERIRDLEDQVRRYEVIAGIESAGLEVPQLTGQVLVVNPEWNFIILDLGEDSKLRPNVEMVVHRGDRMVGKVRVSSVMERVSVAEIQRDWEQIPIQEGDRVFN